MAYYKLDEMADHKGLLRFKDYWGRLNFQYGQPTIHPATW
jgi:hypothetical protein